MLFEKYHNFFGQNKHTLFYIYLLENGVDKEHIIRFAFDSADDLLLIGESLIYIEKEKIPLNV